MKTKITIKFFSRALVMALLLLFGYIAKAQTYVYNDTTASGIFIDGGSEVANPVSDGVNSSTTCSQSGTGWQKIEFFPTYTPVSGDKLYFSIYNPNNVASAQIKFDYTSGSTEVWGGNVTYDAGASSGWVEHSLDLTDHVGNEINKIWLYLASGEANSAYVDNVYFHTSSVLVAPATTTYFFEDAVQNGTIWHAAASEVANPLSDAVNSSSTVIQNTGAGGWQDTQLFPSSYTVQAGDKIYISYYNPNNAAAWQLRMDLSVSGDTWIGEPAHDAGAATAWKEASLDLSAYVGESISQIKIFPAAGESKSVYFDNIYISTSSMLSTNSVAKINNRVFISKEGNIQFYKEQNGTFLSIYDLTGRLILEEKINGKKGEKVLNQKGVYILRVKSVNGVSSQKIAFY
jgi:hypothetical protein